MIHIVDIVVFYQTCGSCANLSQQPERLTISNDRPGEHCLRLLPLAVLGTLLRKTMSTFVGQKTQDLHAPGVERCLPNAITATAM